MDNLSKGYDHIAGQKTTRIESISDGVFAVAMTLLVLDIKVPVGKIVETESDLIYVLLPMLPRLLIYLMSFMTLGIFWMGHTTQFGFIHKSDRNLNWISLFFLMMVCLLPFTTALLSEYTGFKIAIWAYWGNILLCGLTLLAHWRYAVKRNFVTLPYEEKQAISKAMHRRIVIAQLLYFIGALLSFISIQMSIGFIILVQLNYALSLVTRRFKM